MTISACRRSIFAQVIAICAAITAPLAPARANVGSSMDAFLGDVGGAANVTGPSAFKGQSAGYYKPDYQPHHRDGRTGSRPCADDVSARRVSDAAAVAVDNQNPPTV